MVILSKREISTQRTDILVEEVEAIEDLTIRRMVDFMITC